jgi:hypothetical protein
MATSLPMLLLACAAAGALSRSRVKFYKRIRIEPPQKTGRAQTSLLPGISTGAVAARCP